VALYETDADGGLVLPVYVQPGAHAAGLAGRHGDMIKVRVAAPAERNRANAAVCHLIADELGVRPAAVEVVTGRTSRRKRLRVHGVDTATVDAWLAAHGLAHGPSEPRQ
jgi:uncharacterized protein (TIGR00251 family)